MRRIPAYAVLAVLLLPACGINGLSFRQDERVTIVFPQDRARVTLPFTVDWEVTEFQVVGETGSTDPDQGYFGVIIDRDPQPPGETLAWFARDDTQCRPELGCPDEDYLATRRVFSTTATSFTVDVLPDTERLEDRRELHELIVVLLDGSGRRIGEGAWAVEFEVRREVA